MAYICERIVPCSAECPSYRWDDKKGKMACFAQQDMEARLERKAALASTPPVAHSNNCDNNTFDCDACIKNGDCPSQGMDGKPFWMEPCDYDCCICVYRRLCEMPLIERLVKAGVPLGELDHHESDLYVLDTEKSRLIIEAYYANQDMDVDTMAPTFMSTEDKPRKWFDCAFAYKPGYGV